jgi:hypothetical protein
MLFKKVLIFINSPTFSSWLNMASKGAALLLITPIIYKILPSEDVLNWLLLLNLMSFLLILDFGLLPNTIRILSRKIGEYKIKNNFEKHQKVLQSIIETKKLYKYLSFLVFLIFVVLIIVFFLFNNEYKIDLALVSILVVFSGCVAIFNNYYISVLHSYLKVAKVQRSIAILNLSTLLIACLFLILFKSLLITVIVYVSNHFIISIYLRYLFKIEFVGINLSNIERTNVKIIKSEIFNSSWKTGIGVLFSMGLISLSGFISPILFSATLSAQYLFYIQFIRYISSFSQPPFYSEIPFYNRMFGEGNIIKLNKILFKKFNFSLIVYLFLAITVSLILPVLINLFEYEKTISINELWFFLILGFYIERIVSMLVQILTISSYIIWHWFNFIIGISAILFFIISINISNPKIILFSHTIIFSYGLIGLPIISYLIIKKTKLKLVKLIFPHLLLILLFILTTL